jgi:hypothetical protein
LRIQLYIYNAFGFTNNIGFVAVQIAAHRLAAGVVVSNQCGISPDVNWAEGWMFLVKLILEVKYVINNFN